MFKLVTVSFLVLFYSLSTHAYYQRLDPTNLPPSYQNVSKIKDQFLQHAITKGVQPNYSEATLAEAKQVSQAPLEFDGLADLTHLSFVTIDNDYSKDLDQAMYIEFDDSSKRYTLYYAIADAAYFLKPGSELDLQAAERAFTTYLPGFDVPILPRVFSEGLCSLNPLEKRRAVVVIVEFNENGIILRKDFAHAAIRSVAQLSYRKVQDYYEQGSTHEYAGTNFHETLDHLKCLGEHLLNRARARGVIDYSPYELRIEPRVRDGVEGYDIVPYKRYTVEYYNEQISVTSNQMVGEYLSEQGLTSIHRYHPKSEAWKIGKAKRKLKALIKGKSWKGSLQNYIAGISSHPAFDIALGIICRINEKARYSAQNEEQGHSALKVESYDHFTAPMRRYQDVIVHRILLASIENRPVPYQENDTSIPNYLRHTYMVKYAEYVNDMASREAEIQRKNEDFVSSLLLYSHINEPITGKVNYVYSGSKAMVIPDGHMIKRQVLGLKQAKEGETHTFRLEEAEGSESYRLNLVPVD